MENTFGVNIIPVNDIERITVLRRYQIIGTPPEDAFDNVARLASKIFDVPIALVSFVDEKEVFFKANVGLGNTRTTPRGQSLCSLAVLKSEVTVFENAPDEPCLLANPYVAGKFGLKFYAGAPLITHDGFSIGTLCIIDRKSREFSDPDREILAGLAKIVMDEIELRLSAIKEIEKHKLINSQLIDAQDILNLAIEKKDDFIGMVSHELKTPLTSLKALIQILDKKFQVQKDEFAVNAFAKLNKQVAKMTMLINGFLNVSRLESGKMPIDKQTFNFAEMVKDVISEMRIMHPTHNIILDNSEEIFFDGDRGKLESVVSNLLDNAAKYSKRGSSIYTTANTVNGNIKFSVRDQGVGINSKNQQKLFDRYFRVDDIRTKNIWLWNRFILKCRNSKNA